jgi:alpha-L-rhamnosidase
MDRIVESESNPSCLSAALWLASGVEGGPRTLTPASYFRREFSLPAPVVSAQLAITALGLWECEINGQLISEDVLAPGWTDYRLRRYFRIYDVTSSVNHGANAIGIILGDGWYSGHVGLGHRQLYGPYPLVLAQLTVTLADGQMLVVASDPSWKVAEGPILENDLLMGESYDARRDLGTWSSPGYDDSAWRPALQKTVAHAVLEPAPGPPVRRRERFLPVRRWTMSERPFPGETFDLGQNFSGRIRIRVKARAGVTLQIRYAEMLGADGGIYTDNLRGARATDHYTCGSDDIEEWEPRFTFHGFRYVEVTGLQAGHELSVEGIAIYSDLRTTGRFACSHSLLNRLQENIVWGQKSNFLEVPTDCPQRDERLGWTGDAQIFVRTACFNQDVREFFHKWMQDVRDAQTPRGGVATVAPRPPESGHIDPWEEAGPAWSDALIICPWTIYLCYGDRQILEDNYDAMVRFMEFLIAHRNINFIRSHPDSDAWAGFGDWLALDGSNLDDGGFTPRDLIGTAFFAHSADLLGKISDLLGKGDAAVRYRELHQNIVLAFQKRFVTAEGLLASAAQTGYVLALQFELLPEHLRSAAAKELVRDIEKRRFHLSTGFVGTPYLLDVLEKHGHLDVAYRLLEQETFPSWLFPVKNGATTIWERWDGWTPEKGMQDKVMNSFNHYAYGAVGAWMYRSVAGIDLDPDVPAYRRIIFRPRPGGSLTWAEAELETPCGPARIHWKREGESIHLSLTVPPGASATLDLPVGYTTSFDCVEIASGEHLCVLVPREA